MNEKAVVVGLNYQGLAVSRLLGQAGFDVYAFAIPYEMAWGEFRSSRYLRGKVKPYYGIDDLKEKISSVAKNATGGGKLKVFITSSDSLAYLVSDGRELWEKYQVFSGPLTAIDFFSDKAKMYQKCQESDIRTKRFCLLTDYRTSALDFPVILKRNVEKGLMDYKCVKIEDERQLYEIVSGIPDDSQQYIILQECIGPEFADIDMRGYAHGGQIIGYSVNLEARTYPDGVSSYIKEISDPQIVGPVYDQIRKLLEGSGLTGFFAIDMKCNLATGETYILDFNPRSPASVSSWVFKYKRSDLIQLFRNLDHPSPLAPVTSSVTWYNLSSDLKARKKTHEKLNVRELLGAKLDGWDAHDPLPFLLQPLWIVIRKIKKHK